jgi:hypothetical protein
VMEFLSVGTVPIALIWARHSASAGAASPRITADIARWLRLAPYVTVLPESELPAEYGLRADNESGRSPGGAEQPVLAPSAVQFSPGGSHDPIRAGPLPSSAR